MEKSFKETVQAMTAKEIIMAMVEALKEPYYKIDMNDFGCSRTINMKKTCFGCAATNTISRISGIIFTPETIDWAGRSNLIADANIGSGEYPNEETRFLDRFESAIDYLRRGNIDSYNDIAKDKDFATINDDLYIGVAPPYLGDEYTSEQLEEYIKLAELQ